MTLTYVEDPTPSDLWGVGFGIEFDYGQISQDWGGYDYSPGFTFPVGFGDYTGGSSRYGIPGTLLPAVPAEPVPTATGDWVGTPIGIEEVPAPVVIDPDFQPTTTVFEHPGAPYVAPRTRETDWDAVYEAYVELNQPEVDVPFHGSIDWGEVAGTIVGGLFDPFGAGDAVQTAFSPRGVVPSITQGVPNISPYTGMTGGTPGMAGNGCPPTGPKYAKICLATNVITPLRRRRRRRLLTSSDIKDLSALKSIVGGAALQAAVTQAVRR